MATLLSVPESDNFFPPLPPCSARGDENIPTVISRREAIARTLKAGIGFSIFEQLGELLRAEPAGPTAAAPQLEGETVTITLNINGTAHVLSVEPRVTLLDALREYLGMTGTKKGCDHGQCGACTVLVNGQRINSCLSLAVMHAGDEITTVEGLASGEELHPVQAAFIKHDAFQCGYCTPGQICSAVGLIKEGQAKTDAEIREQMAGNLCRCGAYQNIVAAIREALQRTA